VWLIAELWSELIIAVVSGVIGWWSKYFRDKNGGK